MIRIFYIFFKITLRLHLCKLYGFKIKEIFIFIALFVEHSATLSADITSVLKSKVTE